MNDQEFQAAMQAIGHGGRSFSVLRIDAAQRPLAASEQIADQLAEEIAREIIPPRGTLREQALAERFGVSRGPIRDALRLLERDGLVQLSPNRGTTVTGYAPDELRHISEISWPLSWLHWKKLFAEASNDSLDAMVDAQRRTGNLLAQNDPVAFALAVATLSLKQVRFVLGRQGELIYQLLYRPSIRYTVIGLSWEGARDKAYASWTEHVRSVAARDTDGATRTVLTMLRDIHLPVLAKERQENDAAPGRI